jgi:hypothetical protein
MKLMIKDSLKQLVSDRYLLVLSSLLLLLALSFITYIILSVHPSELQLVSHYSAFGITHLYRDQWYYLLSFAVFGLLVAVLHIAIAIKLLIIKGPSLAVMFTWFGIAIILFGWIMSAAVINVWSPL